MVEITSWFCSPCAAVLESAIKVTGSCSSSGIGTQPTLNDVSSSHASFIMNECNYESTSPDIARTQAYQITMKMTVNAAISAAQRQ